MASKPTEPIGRGARRAEPARRGAEQRRASPHRARIGRGPGHRVGTGRAKLYNNARFCIVWAKPKLYKTSSCKPWRATALIWPLQAVCGAAGAPTDGRTAAGCNHAPRQPGWWAAGPRHPGGRQPQELRQSGLIYLLSKIDIYLVLIIWQQLSQL